MLLSRSIHHLFEYNLILIAISYASILAELLSTQILLFFAGPLHSIAAVAQFEAAVEAISQQGGRLLCGGTRIEVL